MIVTKNLFHSSGQPPVMELMIATVIKVSSGTVVVTHSD